MMNAYRNANPSAKLIIEQPGEPLFEVSLYQATYSIGRAADNDIVLVLGHVSSHHGRFERQGNLWTYYDLGSTNGSTVNGQRIQSAALVDGDKGPAGDFDD